MRNHRAMVEIALIAVVIAAAVSTGLLVAGCDNESAPDQTSQKTMPGTTPSTGSTVAIYLSNGEVVQSVSRTVSNAGAREALTEMLKGPTEAEIQQGFATAIPDGTRLLSYKVEDRKATVDFSSELKDYGGGSARVKGIVDQITNTVTANDPTVSSVEITIAGVPSEESLQP